MTRFHFPDRNDADPSTHPILDAAEQALGLVPNLHV
jgi:hypothetical protein